MRSHAATLLLTCGIPAQHLLTVEPVTWMLDPGGATRGDFGAFAAGRFTGLGVPDVLFVRAGIPYLMNAPGLLQGVVRLAGVPGGSAATVDLRVVPNGVAAGRDLVVLLGSYGLATWSYDPAAALATFQVVDASFGAMTRLSLGDLDGDGKVDAVASKPGTLQIWIRSLTAGPTSVRGSGGPVQAAVAVDYDPELPGDELCVVTGNGVRIERGDAPVVVAAFPLGMTVELAEGTRVRSPVGELFVACVRGTVGSTPTTALLGMSALIQPFESSGLFAQRPTGIAVGDMTADACEDVHLMFTGKPTFETVLHRAPLVSPPNPQFPQFEYSTAGGLEASVMGESGPAQDERVRPAVCDVDGDGDDDFVLGWSSATGVLVGFNSYLDAEALRPRLEFTTAVTVQGGQVSSEATLTEDPFGSPPAGATHLELLGWEVRGRKAGSVTEFLVMPDGTHRHTKALTPGPDSIGPFATTAGQSASPLVASYPIVGGYLMFARYVRQGVPDPRVFPAHKFAITAPGGFWPLTVRDGEPPRVVTPLPDIPPPPPPPINEGPVVPTGG
jgi:hypothetical protein